VDCGSFLIGIPTYFNKDRNIKLYEGVIFAPMRCRNFKEFKGGLDQAKTDSSEKCDVSDYNVYLHSSIDEVIAEKWNALVSNKSVFLTTEYFDALRILDENLSYKFACFFCGDDLIGVAAFQITIAESDDLTANITKRGKFIKSVTEKLNGNKSIRFKVLVLGNSLDKGDHGMLLRECCPAFVRGQMHLNGIHAVKN